MSKSLNRRQRMIIRDQTAEYRNEISCLKEQICTLQADLEGQTKKTNEAEFGRDKLRELNESLMKDIKDARNKETEENRTLQVFMLKRKTQLQQELLDLSSSKGSRKNRLSEKHSEIMCKLSSSLFSSKEMEHDDYHVGSSALNDGHSMIAETEEILQLSRLEEENAQLKEKMCLLEADDEQLKMKVNELQQSLNELKLQYNSKLLSHDAIVEALEAVAEEEQASLTDRIAELEEKLEDSKQRSNGHEESQLITEIDNELNEEQMQSTEQQIDEAKKEHDTLLTPSKETTDGDSVSSQYCKSLQQEMLKLSEKYSDTYRELVMQKRLLVEEAVSRTDFLELINKLETEKSDLLQENIALKNEKDEDIDRLTEHIRALEEERQLQNELLKQLTDKSKNRKGWRKLKCW